MKKVSAFILAVLYFIFITFSWWQVNEGGDYPGYKAHEYVIAGSDGGLKKTINQELLLADQLLSKAPKHLSVTGKRNIPRGGSVVLAFRNAQALFTTPYCEADMSMVTPLLYHRSIFLKNRVLRI